MSESVVIEVYENQFNSSLHGWIAEKKSPWTLKSGETCHALDDFTLPGGEWGWASNWRIDKKPGITDEEGWEYSPSRVFGHRQRKRMWSRIMRREAGIGKSADLTRIMPKIQFGLKSINTARMRIEDIMKKAPEAAESDQMKSLVCSVQKNILDITSALDQVERQQGPGNQHGAVIKKLRNDVIKEEAAIERALYPNSAEAATRSPSFSQFRRTAPMGSAASNITGHGGISGSFSSKTLGNVSGGPGSRGSFMDNTPSGSFSGSVVRRNDGFNNTGGINTSSSSGSSSSYRNGQTSAAQVSMNEGNVISSSVPKSSVHSGAAGAFNPAMFATNTTRASLGPGAAGGGSGNRGAGMDDDEQEDGVFVDRTQHERMIEQMLKPVDEATVMQELIDERAVEIQKVSKGIMQVNEMFADLSRIVKEQQVEIDTIFKNVEQGHAKTKDAFQHIVQANKLQASGPCTIS